MGNTLLLVLRGERRNYSIIPPEGCPLLVEYFDFRILCTLFLAKNLQNTSLFYRYGGGGYGGDLISCVAGLLHVNTLTE